MKSWSSSAKLLLAHRDDRNIMLEDCEELEGIEGYDLHYRTAEKAVRCSRNSVRI